MKITKLLAVLQKNVRTNLHYKKKFIGFALTSLLVTLFAFLYQEYKQFSSIIASIFSTFLAMYLATSYSNLCLQFSAVLVQQRQNKTRQYQKIMGLSSFTYIIGHFIYYAINLFVFSSIPIIYLFYYQSYIPYFFILIIGIISTMCVSMLISSFFTSFKQSSQVLSLIFSFGIIFTLFFDIQSKSFSYYLCLILPNSNYAISIKNKTLQYILYPIVQIVVCSLLFVIVQFKINPFSFLSKLKRQKRNIRLNEEIQLGQNITNSQSLNQQIISQSLPIEDKILEAFSLEKQYQDIKALKNLSIKIRRSQIFGLLGRNGSGKTTFIDIITGVIKKSKGSFVLNVKSNNPLGICYQDQVLFQDLTPRQHFIIYSKIKQLQEGYQQIIQKLGLQEHIDKKVKQLSGGNKRKLSVGLAILGYPQLIIFDQPTSGLDPFSRRQLWQILKKLRQINSTVLLTTHHLDEADYLSDKICVIQKGQVLIEGSPQQIKNQYGQGYYLTLRSNALTYDWSQYKMHIKSELKEIEIVDQQKNKLKVFIHLSKKIQRSLPSLLQKLQADKQLIFSLQVNNLEHSFLNLIRNLTANNNQAILQRQQQGYQNAVKSTFMKRLLGITLRSFYLIRSEPFNWTIRYSLNFIVIGFYYKIIDEMMKKAIFGNKNQSNQTSQYNPIYSGSLIYVGYMIMQFVFIIIPAKQRQKKIRKLFNARGVSFIQYWLGTFLFDYIIFVLNLALLHVYVFFEILPPLDIILSLQTGAALILFTYCLSYLFQKQNTALAWSIVINMFVGYFNYPLLVIVKLKPQYQFLTFLRVLYPLSDFQCWCFSLLPQESFCKDLNFPYVYFSILLYITIIIVIQTQVYKIIWKKIFNSQQQIGEQNAESFVKFENVTHKYNKNIVALNNVSFEVFNQRIALLGHNGAGKSTAFDLTSCQLVPTNGKIYVQKKLKRSYQHVLQSVGVCYQQDNLWGQMKTNQIIKIFSLLVGIQNPLKQQNQLFNSLEFQYTNKPFDKLSGGNKRKMCMLVCLIGSPLIRLLDQCSTGLDPSSRQAMMNTIKKRGRKGTTIFTTHSLTQVQQICEKSLILEKGVIKQCGYNFELKKKYFGCYWIKLKFKINFQQDKQKNEEIFQGLVNQLRLNVQFKIIKEEEDWCKIQVDKQRCKLSYLYGMLNDLKQQGKIKQFKISEPTLEDVYLKIV